MNPAPRPASVGRNPHSSSSPPSKKVAQEESEDQENKENDLEEEEDLGGEVPRVNPEGRTHLFIIRGLVDARNVPSGAFKDMAPFHPDTLEVEVLLKNELGVEANDIHRFDLEAAHMVDTLHGATEALTRLKTEDVGVIFSVGAAETNPVGEMEAIIQNGKDISRGNLHHVFDFHDETPRRLVFLCLACGYGRTMAPHERAVPVDRPDGLVELLPLFGRYTFLEWNRDSQKFVVSGLAAAMQRFAPSLSNSFNSDTHELT